MTRELGRFRQRRALRGVRRGAPVSVICNSSGALTCQLQALSTTAIPTASRPMSPTLVSIIAREEIAA